jgi:ABC-type cobalamin/Fe3+-siderophores transport system ATPase subunit
MIAAESLSARGVFDDVSFEVPRGGFLVIRGDHRSGKTALLLAIAGRFSTRGALDTAPAGRVALAEQSTINALDDALTVEAHFAQAVALARPWWKPVVSRAAARAAAAGALPVELPLDAKIGSLTPFERFACGVGLALVASPDILAVDDVDALRDTDDRVAAWHLLLDLPDTLTIVATCQDAGELPVVVDRPLSTVSL